MKEWVRKVSTPYLITRIRILEGFPPLLEDADELSRAVRDLHEDSVFKMKGELGRRRLRKPLRRARKNPAEFIVGRLKKEVDTLSSRRDVSPGSEEIPTSEYLEKVRRLRARRDRFRDILDQVS